MRDSIEETWISVTTSKGMFNNEYAVFLKLADGKEVSFFADKELFRKEGNNYLLKVGLVKRNQLTQLILLPSETLETASRWVEVMAK